MAVGRPARRQQVVATRVAVDAHLVEPERGDVEPGAGDRRRRRRTPAGGAAPATGRRLPGSSGQRDGRARPSRAGSRRPASTRSGVAPAGPARTSGRAPGRSAPPGCAAARPARPRRPGRRHRRSPVVASSGSKPARSGRLDLVRLQLHRSRADAPGQATDPPRQPQDLLGADRRSDAVGRRWRARVARRRASALDRPGGHARRRSGAGRR